MDKELKDKSVVIIGASGGLGSGIAKAFSEKGARLLLAGRNEEKLRVVKDKINGDITIVTVDVTDSQSVEELSRISKEWSTNIDVVINASGTDIRKSLEDHSPEDIKNLMEINLMGTILITKAFMRCMKNEQGSTIVHIGGFADGRMAFPFYSVDVATRAGVFSFVEAINRELEIEGKAPRVTFFCPSPADTEAEKPFHSLWRKMGITIVPVEKVAAELINTIHRKKTIGIMGGFTTILFAKINSVMPKLADAIVMKKYGKMLKEFLYGTEDKPSQKPIKKSNLLNKVAIILVAMSFILYGLIFMIPFLPLTIAQKAALVPVLIASGEATWWIGVAIVGKQAVTKYRKYLNPCNWVRCIK